MVKRWGNVTLSTMTNDRRIPSNEAAKILGISDDLLRHWRLRGHGPTYIIDKSKRVGKGGRPSYVFYLEPELERFIALVRSVPPYLLAKRYRPIQAARIHDTSQR